MTDFFDDLGKKITGVASDIGKKTGETLEIQKIKGDIYMLNRKNERDFREIGRIVYEKFRNHEVEDIELVSLCESIEERDQEIEQYRDEIANIKGEA